MYKTTCSSCVQSTFFRFHLKFYLKPTSLNNIFDNVQSCNYISDDAFLGETYQMKKKIKWFIKKNVIRQ